jgi:hypothetical protein
MKIGRHDLRKLRAVCADNESIIATKYNLGEPYLDVEEKVLVASNGYALVAFPVEPENNDISGIVPWAAFDAAAEIAFEEDETSLQNVRLDCGERVIVYNRTKEVCSYPRPKGKYPNWKVVVPVRTGPATITLDARLLLGIQDALGCEGLSLWITNSKGQVLIGGTDECNEGVAVVMPMRHKLS